MASPSGMSVRSTSTDESLALGGVYAGVEAYYSRKLAKYGATPLGVDWTCVATQEMRFVHLLKISDFSSPFSLNDLGCGYGALVTYLAKYHPFAEVDYLGIDVSSAMVRRAKRAQRGQENAKFVTGRASPRVADYSVASGVFNVKLRNSRDAWERFVGTTLAQMDATSRRGFAVNFMAPAAPDQPSAAELYRTEPDAWIEYCEETLGRSVELVADYGMREFTLLVRPKG